MPTLISPGVIYTAGGSGAGGGGSTSWSPNVTYTPFGEVQSDSPDLPEMVIVTNDEHGKTVRMSLKPESNISNNELMKLVMLITAMSHGPSKFNAFAHVKKNNLERHFTYA